MKNIKFYKKNVNFNIFFYLYDILNVMDKEVYYMEDLLMKVNSLEDSRQQWKVKHNLVDILIIVMLSILTGHNDFEEMIIFAEARVKILRKYIKLENGIPHKDTLKRVIAIIDPNQLNLVFYSWLANIINKKNHVFLDEINKIIAFDGKTICGSDDIYNRALHILTAFDTENELVLGQLPVDEKTNEITVMPELIKLLDLEDCVVTADALNCQYEIANAIVEKKGNYVLALKGNKGDLYEDVKDYFDDKAVEQIIAKNELYRKTIEKAHSQIEIREYFLILDIDYIKKNKGNNYNKLTSIGMVRKTIENLNSGKITTEFRYYINSIYDIDLFAKVVRREWGIENNLHWHLDYTLKEDNSTIIDKKVAYNLNIIRKSVLSILKIIDIGKKYSLKNKIHYINDNFDNFFPTIIEQLSNQV